MGSKLGFWAAAGAGLLALALGGGLLSARRAVAEAGERQPFSRLLLVPPDERDYTVAAIPEGARAVVTDVVMYNVADGKSHRVPAEAESYVWLGGYAGKTSVGVVNRMRVLGNETQQWHFQTGMELAGAPELVVSSEKVPDHGA